MKFVRYIILNLLLCISLCAVAQKRGGDVMLTVLYRSGVQLSGQKLHSAVVKGSGSAEYLYRLHGAFAVLKQKGDTVKQVLSGDDGVCVFKNIPSGDYSLEISHYGYETYVTNFEHSSGQSTIEAILSENTQFLEAIKVKGDIPLILRKGDTLVVNPLAVETPVGAAAIEIIKQVPGIEITEDGGMTVFGEQLARSYVGGTTLFGTGVLTALKNLDADLVKNIEFYDEEQYMGAVNGAGRRKKVKVMNIETTKTLLSSVTGHLFAGVGKDIDRADDKVRFKSGASLNLFNSKIIINSSAHFNNVGLYSTNADYLNGLLSARNNGEKRLAAASVQVEKNFGDPYNGGSSLLLGYSYNHDDSKNLTLTEKVYFASGSLSNRTYTSQQQNNSINNSHNVSAEWRGFGPKKKTFYNFTHSMNFQQNSSNVWSDMLEKRGGENILSVADSSMLDSDLWSVSENLLVLSQKIDLSANLTFGKNDGSSLRKIDERGTERVFESSPVGENLVANARLGFTLFKNTRGVLSVNYDRQSRKQLRYDITQQPAVFDPINSLNYSTNNWNNAIEINSSWLTKKKDDSKMVKSNTVSLRLKQTLVNDFNRLKGKDFSRSFYTPECDIRLYYNNFGLSYNLSASVPYVEQLRDYVDDTNPLYLRTGNPDLKASFSHTMDIRYDKGVSYHDVSFMSISLSGTVRQNAVVPYTVYEDGVTLESYRNVKSDRSLAFSLNYGTRFPGIKTKLDLFIRGAYNSKYSYVKEDLNRTDSYNANLAFSTNTSFRNVTLTLNSTTGYSASDNSHMARYDYFNQTLKAVLNVTLLKRFYLNGAYNFIFNMPTGNTQGILNRNNIFNAAAGINLFKGRLKAGFSIFDIFDSSTDFSTMLYSDYIQNTWTPSFGRYWSFDLVFNLRANKFQ